MLVFLNGRLVPEERAVVSIFDRGFLYGDGLFETMRIFKGKPFRWSEHLDRLERGAEFLKIKPPFSSETLRGFADELIVENKIPDALLRLTLSRGVGVRGYSPKGADNPIVVMSLHPAPGNPRPSDGKGAGDESSVSRWKLITSSQRLPANDTLAQFKTCNKLPQILARAEADAAGADEALLLNTDGFVVEGASSNLFWIERDTICTSPLASGVLPGVTRTVVVEICRTLDLKVAEKNIDAKTLKTVEGVFVSLSSFGVVEAQSLDGGVCKRSSLVERLFHAYREWQEKESA